jgi:D-sedoheptulose 7-phosphate isomerase
MKSYVQEYTSALGAAMANFDAAQFENIIRILTAAYRGDKQIIIAGNGGSAGTANHFVCDFGKNAVLQRGKRRFRVISISDNVEKITAIGNDVAFEEIFRQQLINLLNDGDVFIAVSASGNSPDILRACEYAREKNARIVALAGFKGGRLKDFAEAAMVVPLESYEQIEDIHLVILHMVVYYFKNHPELLD